MDPDVGIRLTCLNDSGERSVEHVRLRKFRQRPEWVVHPRPDSLVEERPGVVLVVEDDSIA